MTPGTIAVLLPYYNEADFIGDTLRSLLRQSRKPDQLILVDNASTDGSAEACRRILEEEGYASAIHLHDDRPGKVNALETGCRHLDCEYTALCDADLYYPPHYLDLAMRLFDGAKSNVSAVMGQCVERLPSEDMLTRRKLRRTVLDSRIFTTKCFAGGAAQIFRTRALLEAGGFSSVRWNYVLLDHEIVHRVHKRGRSLYHEDLWCLHTDRRADRGRVRWSLYERIVYRYTPGWLGDWYFYSFLGPRLARRRMTQLNLREQPWKDEPRVSGPSTDAG